MICATASRSQVDCGALRSGAPKQQSAGERRAAAGKCGAPSSSRWVRSAEQQPVSAERIEPYKGIQEAASAGCEKPRKRDTLQMS